MENGPLTGNEGFAATDQKRGETKGENIKIPKDSEKTKKRGKKGREGKGCVKREPNEDDLGGSRAKRESERHTALGTAREKT